MNPDGSATRQAQQRIMGAAFSQAYGNTDLTRLFTQAQDTEARTAINALASAAPDMAKTAGGGADRFTRRQCLAQRQEPGRCRIAGQYGFAPRCRSDCAIHGTQYAQAQSDCPEPAPDGANGGRANRHYRRKRTPGRHVWPAPHVHARKGVAAGGKRPLGAARRAKNSQSGHHQQYPAKHHKKCRKRHAIPAKPARKRTPRQRAARRPPPMRAAAPPHLQAAALRLLRTTASLWRL